MILVFGHPELLDSGTLCHLASNMNSSVRSLGVNFDFVFKFEKQISSTVNFSQLRRVAKIETYLPPKVLERVGHAFSTSQIDFWDSTDVSLDQLSIQRRQLLLASLLEG